MRFRASGLRIAALGAMILALATHGWAQDSGQAAGAKLRIEPTQSQPAAATQEQSGQTGSSDPAGAKLRMGAAAQPSAGATQAPADQNSGVIEAKTGEAEAPAMPTPMGLADYRGTVGAKQIRLTLVTQANGTMKGSYFLPPDLNDIEVEGRMIDAQSLSLREVRADRSADGSIYLKKMKTANGDGFTGMLASPDGKTSLALTLQLQDALAGVDSEKARYDVTGAQDAAELEKNAQVFYAAVLANSPEQAAAAVSFPLAYTANGRRTLLHTPADFVAKYSAIFTPAFVAEIRNATPHQMFANYQGVMLGTGLVWFDQDGKAFALNNEPVKMFAGKQFLTNAGWKGAASGVTKPGPGASTATQDSQTGKQAGATSKTSGNAGAKATRQTTSTSSKTRRRHHGKRSKAAAATTAQ